MKTSKITKNKKTEKISNKIIINSITDLLKIPIHKLNNSNLENLSGDYFDKIYQEVINSENQLDKEAKNAHNKINKPKKNSKEKKNKKNIDKKFNTTSKKKQKYNLNENNFINQNDFYIEELELSESDHEINHISNSQNNTQINYIKLNTNNNIEDNNRNNKIKYTKINKDNDNKINYITPFSNDEKEDHIFGRSETPDINDENEDNNIYIKSSLYTPTPTPMPDEEEDKKDGVVYPLNKIIFSINYNSFFGEEVCILGSSPKLGLWNLDGALHLKWNEGNLWKGEINIEVENLQDFEFKYVITEKGTIKYWESGDNNIINFTGLINEFQFKNKGSYNKYGYDYDPNEGSLLIKSKWYK